MIVTSAMLSAWAKLPRRLKPIRVRFEEGYIPEPNSGCWLWLGAPTDCGYGMATGLDKRRALAHRVSWTLHRGPIPPGLCVLHRCDNPPCVNPDHLFLGTHLDNMRDMDAKGRNNTHVRRTHCKQGHELTSENTYLYPGQRRCRTCAMLRASARHASLSPERTSAFMAAHQRGKGRMTIKLATLPISRDARK